MTKRQEKALETKEKLIEAARKVIVDKGYKETSIEDITKVAGVATGTFYTYFKTKDDVINVLGFSNFNDLKEKTLQMNESLEKRLFYHFSEFMRLVEEYDVFICRLWIMNNLNNQCKLEYDTNTMNEILLDAIARKELQEETPVKNITDFMINGLYGMMLNWCMSNKSFEPLDNIDDFTQNMCSLLEKWKEKGKKE